jgi:hypothetical protein
MKKFKLDNDPQKEPSKEAINQYKDFDGLLTNYNKTLNRLHKKPLYKDPKFFIAMVMFLLIIYLVFESMRPEDQQNDAAPPIEETK